MTVGPARQPTVLRSLQKTDAVDGRPYPPGRDGWEHWMDEKVRPERLPHRGKSSEIRPRTEKEIRVYVKSSMGFLGVTAETVSIVHRTAIVFLFDDCDLDRPWARRKDTTDRTISWECFLYLRRAFGGPERFQRESVGGCQGKSLGSRVGQDLQEEEQGGTQWEAARKDPQEVVAKGHFSDMRPNPGLLMPVGA